MHAIEIEANAALVKEAPARAEARVAALLAAPGVTARLRAMHGDMKARAIAPEPLRATG